MECIDNRFISYGLLFKDRRRRTQEKKKSTVFQCGRIIKTDYCLSKPVNVMIHKILKLKRENVGMLCRNCDADVLRKH